MTLALVVWLRVLSMLEDWLNDGEDVGDDVAIWLSEIDCVAVADKLGVPETDSVGA